MDELQRIKNLQTPDREIDVVLDTDAYNEIDDQYAIAYLLRSKPKLHTRALYAAPFFDHHSESPADGMEKSYQEIKHLLHLMRLEEMEDRVFRGSETYLKDEKTPVISPAAEHLCALAMEYSAENPLYVVSIGAITNIASAILLRPEITERIVVVWLGGNAVHWPNNREFNLIQDIAAARVVFGSGVPLVQLPAMGVVSAFTVSEAELLHWLRGRNELCDYLVQHTVDEMAGAAGNPWSRPIWDVTAVAWLLGGFTEDSLIHAPIPEYDHYYAHDPARHFMKYVYHIYRDALVRDLFEKLSRQAD